MRGMAPSTRGLVSPRMVLQEELSLIKNGITRGMALVTKESYTRGSLIKKGLINKRDGLSRK